MAPPSTSPLTSISIDALKEPAALILGQMAARRGALLLAGRAVPSGSGCCRRDGRGPAERCMRARGAVVLVEVKKPRRAKGKARNFQR